MGIFKSGGPVNPPVRTAGQVESDAELIARACWVIKAAIDDRAQTMWRDAANVPLVDLCLDLRAVLVRSEAGRAVLRPHANVPVLVDPIHRLRTLLDAQRIAAGKDLAAARQAAAQDVAELQGKLAEAKTRIAQLEGELAAADDDRNRVADAVLSLAPESWDLDQPPSLVAVQFVTEMFYRMRALRVPLDRYPEDADGAPWPDATDDPNGFADAADAYRSQNSGCRCQLMGLGTPEHSPSWLCRPRPGDRTWLCWHEEKCDRTLPDCAPCSDPGVHSGCTHPRRDAPVDAGDPFQ